GKGRERPSSSPWRGRRRRGGRRRHRRGGSGGGGGGEAHEVSQPVQRRRRDREIGAHARQERRQTRGLKAHGPVPEIVGNAQAEVREQLGGERVAERLGLPPGPPVLLGLLEVVLQGA